MEDRAKARLGTVLRGKYRLDRLLGIGGMAAVYKATHRNRAEFAIKLLHTELSIHESVRTRFVREGYAANSVQHPGAVLVVDDDIDENGQAFLVMELLRGEELDKLRVNAGGTLEPPIVVALVLQLLDVLGSAHTQGIVHRDIKPPNLFVTTSGMLKVLDFGIARARDVATESAGVTGTGILLGTPAYMAPEQAMAQPERIGGRTDLWAAGATLFTLLTGEYVHGSMPAMQAVISTATKPAPPLLSVWQRGDPGVAAVVDRALAFEPEARWASAAEMRAALESAARAAFGAIPTRDAVAEWLEEQDPALVSTHRGGASSPSFEADRPVAAHDSSGVRVTPSSSDAAEVVRESFASNSTMPVTPAPEVVPRSVARTGATVEARADTTARPVSSGSARLAELPRAPLATTAVIPRRRSNAWLAGPALVVAAAMYWWLSPPRTVGRAMSAASAPEPTAPVSVVGGSPAPAASTAPVPVEPAPSGDVPPAPQVALSAPVHQDPRPLASTPATPATAAPVTPPRTAPSSDPRRVVTPPPPRAPHCDPNFTLDADGHKHFKPECFR